MGHPARPARRLAETLRLIALFAVGSLVMRAAGCVVNDLWDRDIDRKVARTAGRPLASGALRPRQALVFLAVLLLVGLGVLLQLNRLAQVLGVASLLLVGLYPLAKRVTWWPQLMMGFTFGFGAPMGYAAAAGRMDAAWVALYAAAILWDLGFDTIYAHQDREDDALVGVRSTARLFGEQTRPFLAACYAAAVVALALAGWLAGLGAWFYPVLVLPAALLARQVVALDIHDPAGCLRLFRANREVGLAVGLAILAGWLVTDRLTGDAFIRANTVLARAAPCARDPAAPRDRDHADLAGDRNLAGGTQHRAAVLGVRLAGRAGAGAACAGQPGFGRRQAGAGFRRRRRHRGDRLRAWRGQRRWRPRRSTDLALAAIGLNAAANGVEVAAVGGRGRRGCRWDLILCGDVCYEAPMTGHIMPWLTDMARTAEVWIADPGPRLFAADRACRRSRRYRIETTLELEDRTSREVTLYRVLPPADRTACR